MNNNLSRFADSKVYFQCPICTKSMDIQGNSLICRHGHCFDISRYGYVNLLLKSSPKTNYSKRSFDNRHQILEYGMYDVVLEKIIQFISDTPSIRNILDVGCGEGFYARQIQQRTERNIFAFDLSREAIQIASKKDKRKAVKWFVTDLSKIPLKDGKPVHNLYNTDAAWGAQWNLTQVWALAYPEYYSDYISSHLLVYKDAGWLADGIANSRYVSGVGTNLLSTIIAGAYQCGIRDFDVNTAYEACLKNELDGENRPLGAGKIDTRYFVEYGYVPHLDKGDGPDEAFMFSASHTLEYAYSAWAVAQWAKQLGKTDDYNRLMDLSKGWERIYDPSCNFVRPKKKDGTFIEDFNPMQVWRGFQEGNAWQYTFYVPHDAKGLVAKVGADVFNHRLDSIFTVSRKLIFSGGTEVGAFAGLQTLYNQGNQPCLHISWMFNEAGRPSLTQKWVRAILNEFYGTDGIHGYGYGQDEDQGQLGAWYVISSLGLFDMKGLTDQAPSFALGSPLFDKITIRLNDRYYKGKEFVIETRNNSKQNDYVQSMDLNGKPLTDTRIPFSEIVQGGHLVLEMGNQPKDRYEN